MVKLELRVNRCMARINIVVFLLLLILLLRTEGVFAAPPIAQATKQISSAPPTQASVAETVPDVKLIEGLLKKQYKVVAVPQSSWNPYPRLAPRSSKARGLDFIDSKYGVFDVKPIEDKGFFRRQKILSVAVSDTFLEARMKLGHRSSGLFAFDGKELTYLNGADSAANMCRILRRENRSLSDADPEMLANLFAMTIFRHDNDRVDVIPSTKELVKYDRPNAAKINEKLKNNPMGLLYATTVDKIELEKCKGHIIQPSIIHQAKGGWRCVFIGLRGFMYKIRVPFSLVRYEISVSPNFDLSAKETILNSKIIN